MSSSGTLLSDLDGNGGGGGNDSDLVKKIFADMNMSSGANPIMGGGGSGSMIMSPNPNTTAPIAMDSAPATSHIIGKDHPSAADFAAAMHGVPRSPDAQMGLAPPMPNNIMAANGGAGGNWSAYMQPTPPPMMLEPEVPKKNLYARIADELKMPVLVAILVFIFSLPFLNILFSHYIPTLVKPTGDLTHIGLLVKAALAGSTFWILLRVIAPLLSL